MDSVFNLDHLAAHVENCEKLSIKFHLFPEILLEIFYFCEIKECSL